MHGGGIAEYWVAASALKSPQNLRHKIFHHARLIEDDAVGPKSGCTAHHAHAQRQSLSDADGIAVVARWSQKKGRAVYHLEACFVAETTAELDCLLKAEL